MKIKKKEIKISLGYCLSQLKCVCVYTYTHTNLTLFSHVHTFASNNNINARKFACSQLVDRFSIQ